MNGAYVWVGVRKAFHILIYDCFFPVSCVLTSGPASAGSFFLSVSLAVSIALVPTLATVSVHFCLCRVGLHTCKCQSTASSSVSVTVRVVILTAPLNESIINAYRRQSQNSCSYFFPQGSKSESSCAGTRVSSHYNNFLSG